MLPNRKRNLHQHAFMYSHYNMIITSGRTYDVKENVNYINNSLETLIWKKRKFPPVGVEPDASHLLDKHPRLLDHRGFPNLP